MWIFCFPARCKKLNTKTNTAILHQNDGKERVNSNAAEHTHTHKIPFSIHATRCLRWATNADERSGKMTIFSAISIILPYFVACFVYRHIEAMRHGPTPSVEAHIAQMRICVISLELMHKFAHSHGHFSIHWFLFDDLNSAVWCMYVRNIISTPSNK